ncbi:MAG: hypothetical protein IJ376_03645, partial [Acidaminococcaceae bacterium]|nr:hypothetical protein [Acidaminococcaceae bacterium]
AAGVVDGYADGAFDGDKLMTRYEMAQIVAKAMAKGANVDKLAAEFADELDTLGVRVAKLEKGADAVKISGNIRYSLKDVDGDDENRLRSRIYFKGAVNDDWTYTGMLENNQYFTSEEGTASEEDTKFQRAYLEGKLGGLKVTAGRYNENLVNGNLYDTRADGVKATYGDKVKLTGFYIKPTNQGKDLATVEISGKEITSTVQYDNAWGAKVDTKVGVVDVTAGYTVFGDGEYKNTYEDAAGKVQTDGAGSVEDNKVWNVGVAMNLAKELKFTADYLQSNWDEVSVNNNDVSIDDEGIILGLQYKGAKASAPGSWGLYGNWYDQGRGTVVAHTMNGEYGSTGFEGWMVGANYALAKNIVAAIEYYDLETKEVGSYVKSEDLETLWAQVVFTF